MIIIIVALILTYYYLINYVLNLFKVICVGLNYKGHCDEQNKPYPKEPFFFSKFPSTIIGPNDAVKHSSKSKVNKTSCTILLDVPIIIIFIVEGY